MRDLSIGSLFSGIGGLEAGLEMCGWGPVVWQCDSDPVSRAVLEQHWPGVKRYEDVRDIDAAARPVRLLCGGFPCQDLSVAGKGRGLSAERSGLWWEFRRVIRTLRPGLVFVENVYRGWRRWLPVVRRSLWKVGYASLPLRVRAADVGAPHDRARCFVLAYAHSADLRHPEQRQPARRPGGLRDEGLAEPRDNGAEVADADGRRLEVLGGSQPGRLEGARGSESDGRMRPQREHRFPPGPDRIDSWDGPKPAVRRGTSGVSREVVPSRPRQLRLLGNSVVPQQAARAFEHLLALKADRGILR